jgi:hypothetical protein
VSQKEAVTLRRVGGSFASLCAHQFFEVVFALVRFDHVASRIVNADHSMM